MRIFLNPGHSPNGNPDPGAVNSALDLRECDIAKTIADLVEGYLNAAGVQVVGNLQSDSLGEITDTANASGADIFVSIHCNSFANPNAQGTEVCVFPGSAAGRELGGYIQRQIVDRFSKIDPDFPDRGLKTANFHVVRETDMPACLVEMAFICNAEDAALLKHHADDFARAIAVGVTDYEQAIS